MHTPHHVLITGGAGFIGCNLVRHLIQHQPDWQLTVLDALTYAGSRHNLNDIESQILFVPGDIIDPALVGELLHDRQIDTVVHLAAESHVDRSIDEPMPFIRTNVDGTACLLDAATRFWDGRQDVRFHQVSTDEVFGDLEQRPAADEQAPYAPSSPYAASKAAADHLVRAWSRTYGLPISISNCGNNYGPYQFPEKLIPLVISKALRGEALPLYGDGLQIRDWLHVQDHCTALARIIQTAPAGSSWNISARAQVSNRDLLERLLTALQQLRPCPAGDYRDLITPVADRPGHDRRYALDPSRLETDLDWQPHFQLADGLQQTVHWYLNSADWLQHIHEERYTGERLGQGS
jgi:dTDP-glucose 4,6-dehydratase